MDPEIDIFSGKVSSDHVHIFVSYRPQMTISKLVQYLKGTSSRILLQEDAHLRKQFWGRHFGGRGYMDFVAKVFLKNYLACCSFNIRLVVDSFC